LSPGDCWAKPAEERGRVRRWVQVVGENEMRSLTEGSNPYHRHGRVAEVVRRKTISACSEKAETRVRVPSLPRYID